MAGCEDGCGAKAVEAANTPEYVRVLWLVVAMNAAMFVVGVVVTATGGSGAVRLTLTSLPSWLPRAVADWDDEATFFQTPPFPTGCDPARDLAVFSVQPQPS